MTIVELLKIDDLERFSARFFEMGGADPVRSRVLFKDACRYAAANLYPGKYEPPFFFVPHSYMGLIAAWEARQYLDEADRWRPVFQGLWHLAVEARNWRVIDRTPPALPTGSDVSIGAPGDALARAAADRDLDRFFSVFSACHQDPKLRRLALGSWLSIALRDTTNIGHKYIYALKTVQLSRFTRWEDAGIHYSPMQFLFVAPEDPHISWLARTELDSHREKLNRVTSRSGRLGETEVEQLRAAVLGNSRDASQAVIELLSRGYAVEAVLDALTLVSSHIVYRTVDTGDEAWWVYPVHGFNFLQSVRHGLGLLDREDRTLAVLVTAIYLSEIVKATAPLRDEPAEEIQAPRRVSVERLAEAVASRNVEDALAQVKGLLGQGLSADILASALSLIVARKERFLFAHVVKYLTFLLPVLADSPRTDELLMPFVRFLAMTPGDSEAMRAAEGAVRQRAANTSTSTNDG